MFLQDFFLACAGVGLGVTGAIPFLHLNLLLEFLQGNLPVFAVGVLAVSLSFSRLLFECFASTFLLIPSESQGAGALPAQRLALQGKGISVAIEVMRHSMAFSLVLSIGILPFYLLFSPLAFDAVRPFVWLVLLALLIFLLSSEASLKNACLGFLVFCVAGAFGFLAFTFPRGDSLFPLLCGLFGFSSLLMAWRDCAKIPLQEEAEKNEGGEKEGFGKEIAVGTLAGAFSNFLPALSPAFISAGAYAFFEGKGNEKSFLALNAAVVISKNFFDFAALFAIDKARSGAAAALKPVVSANLMGMLEVALIAVFSFFASLKLFAVFLPIMLGLVQKVQARLLQNFYLALFAVLLLSVFLLSGFWGVFVAAISTAIGLLPVLWKVKRSYAMGALVLPAILYLSGADLAAASFAVELALKARLGS